MFRFVFFALLALIIWERSDLELRETKKNLETKRHHLEEKIDNQKTMSEKLQAELNSQSDPAWIEQILKVELGVVPENQRKVYVNRR